MPRAELDELLRAANLENMVDERVLSGVFDDAGIVKISKTRVIVQHLDFFTPIIDDPYLQGKIAACNSASDVFSKGATDIIGVLVIFGNPVNIPEEILRDLMKGFYDFCHSINAPIVGGHTIVCPWPIMGGSVTAIAEKAKVVYNTGAKKGDVVVLTKPLGTQPAMGILRVPEKEKTNILKTISRTVISRAIDKAIEVMITPNKEAAEVMVEIGVNACTDVTGFGFLGHSEIMAKRSCVDIELHTLPVIRGTIQMSSALGYGLELGESAETSGGLLISVEKGKVDLLIAELKRKNIQAYEVGVVRRGLGKAFLSTNCRILEV